MAVYFLFPSTVEAALREIKIHAAVSHSFKFNPDWDRDIQDRILFANEIFEPLFGIHFSVEKFIAWDPEDETRETDLLMEELRGFIPLGDSHVVVGFHKMGQPFSKDQVVDNDTVGSAQFFKGFVVIRDPFGKVSRMQKDVVMTHEFAHLFGGVHVADPNAIMSPTVPENPTLLLDSENIEIIKATRNVNFHTGLDSLNDETLDKLIHAYEKLIRKNPHSDFYYQLGKFYEKRKQMARAVSTWEEAVKYHYDNPHIHRELGFHYYREGRYGQAIQELGSAVAHFILPSQRKQKAEVLNFLGVAYYFKKNLDQAIVTWLQALTENPDDHVTQSNLAIAFLESGNVERAVNELRKLSAKNLKDPTILSNFGAALMRQGNFDEAVEVFQKALEAKKLSKQALKSDSKADALSELMGEVPDSMIFSNLGASYLELGDFPNAIRALAHSKQLDPDNPGIYRALSRAYLEVGEHDKAIEAAQRSLKLKKDDAYVYALLGKAYADQGKIQESIQMARDGLRYATGTLSANLHKNLAVLYAQTRRYSEAKEELRVSLNQNWNDAETHFHLGNLYAREGEVQQARRSFQAALRVNPQYESARQALDLLAKRAS